VTETGTPDPKNRTKVRAALAVLGVLVVGGTVYLALDAFSSGSVFFRYVDEAVRERPEIGDRKIKVSGSLVGGTVESFGDGGRRFTLERNGVRLTVVSPDPSLPEGFGAPGQDVIVDGTFAADGSLSATLVTTGCPSKYEARKAGPDATP
jgi:cytochrome c-type biogenesis protein CcmE